VQWEVVSEHGLFVAVRGGLHRLAPPQNVLEIARQEKSLSEIFTTPRAHPKLKSEKIVLIAREEIHRVF